ncbi:MAG: response regulator transcription factor [Chloroflexia bacterium]
MTNKGRILVVDDDTYVCESLAALLGSDGYTVFTAHNGNEALRRLYREKPDLVLLDVIMPGMDGWEVCRRIREMSDVPIVMLTARGQVKDRVRGLDLGADDYLVKPVAVEELRARVRAALRRGRLTTEEEQRPLSFDGGRLVVDLRAGEVRVAGERVALRPLEMRLLSYLVRNAGLLLTHDQILEQVWGHPYVGDRPSLKLYIWRLRQKIEEDPQRPRCIQTERGLGYRFIRPDR